MKKADILIFLAVLLLAGTLFSILALTGRQTDALTADIYVNGALYESVPLADPPRDIEITGAGGVNVLRVEAEQVYMLEADCPGQFCVHQGPIRRAGQTIACLPHRVLVVLTGGGERGDVDVVAG